ncbi:MAG TPA: efflux RND transporter periplasmic adaptor subunit [Acidobacteriota bacterium]|nr:efflux RND transporter periplasmic adaptor subunit [Acidobacteriota bacterium]
MWRKWFAIGVVLVLLGGAVALWPDEKQIMPPHASAIADGVAAEGRIAVKPDQRAVLSAEIAGRLERILVDNLNPVTKGQLLAVLYNADLEQQIRQTEELYRKAEADYTERRNGSRSEDIEEAAALVRKAESELELAMRNEERDRRLFQEEVVSQSKLDTTIAERKRSEAELRASQQRWDRLRAGERQETIAAAHAEMLSQKFALEALKAAYAKTFVRSPLNGLVVRRYRNASEFTDVGDPIVEVANLSEMIVEADINEMDIGRVSTGMKAVITSDAFPDQQFRGQVYEVSAALKKRESDPEDPAVVIDQKILPIKVRLLQPAPLKLGMKVDLRILR